jgi:alanyl-tRNA synthetase
MSQPAQALRQSFLDYFKKNGHEAVRSSPLVPQNDPTLLFTNAGMVQFKDVFTGREQRAYKRATTSQKCVRAGGKHNDLENVGRTARHHTFFEMLGNFSFGDYFKEGAILYAWEWLTKSVAIDPSRLVVSVFGGDDQLKLGPDDEARALWKKVTGFGDERIFGMGRADNFWMMGDTGPQGPCSEIYYFVGDGKPDLSLFNQEIAPDGTGWVEIWNLVFMQYERKTADSPLTPLPKPSIDTGAGLERVTAVVQGKRSNYDTDAFAGLLETIAAAAKKKYAHSPTEDDVSMRVIADHARATAFLVADGVMPTNEGRGYVLRRIMRRAIRHGVRLGGAADIFPQACGRVVKEMCAAYPELTDAQSLIVKTATAENEAFQRTLDRGIKLLDEQFGKLAAGATLPGETVFRLYDTFGFPADLTRVIAEERGFAVDESGFERSMKEQRERGDFGGSGEAAITDHFKDLDQKLGTSQFLGYEATEGTGKLLWLHADGDKVQLVADRTPFYGEAGGQIGDSGVIEGEGFAVAVSDTLKTPAGVIVHVGKITRGQPEVGQEAKLVVDVARRDAIRANHSATHLLHLALKEVLGAHVAQKGSLVAPDRLRFDFSHFAPMTDEEKRKVEDLVNDEVRRNLDSQISVMSFDEARKSGAVALFGEKYGDTVRVMRIGGRSVELCGGTHVKRTGDIGLFKITTEIGIAQGVRRIEAVTGAGALGYLRRLEDELGHVAERVKSSPFEAALRVERLQDDLKAQRREIDELKRKMALGGGGRDLMSGVREVGGVKVLATRADVGDPKALREVADQLRSKIGSGVIVLGGVGEDGKVALVAAVTADLTQRIHAGKIIGEVSSAIGGKGGGRPDMAQGGGSDAGKLDAALERVYTLVG